MASHRERQERRAQVFTAVKRLMSQHFTEPAASRSEFEAQRASIAALSSDQAVVDIVTLRHRMLNRHWLREAAIDELIDLS